MIQCQTASIVYTDIKFQTGEDHNVPLTFTDANGDPIDITGATVSIAAKKFQTQAANDLLKQVTSHTDAANGLTTIALLTSDTDSLRGAYYMAILLHLADDTDILVIKGFLIVENTTVTGLTS